MTLEMEQLDRQIAEALGWAPKGEQPWWRIPVGGTAEYVLEHDLPHFTTSIDAQHLHADSALEAKWGKFDEEINWSQQRETWNVILFVGGNGDLAVFCGEAPTRAAARAAAILEALKQ